MPLAEYLNELDETALGESLGRCCAAQAWIEQMKAARPFASDASVLERASQIWWTLHRGAWLEAFAAHPQIGDLNSLRAKYADTRQWAGGEQSGVAGADDATLQRLAQMNQAYANRFGHIFIVCATGKSAAEMLAILESRLPNEAAVELRIAAGEQLKITQLRLQKLSV